MEVLKYRARLVLGLGEIWIGGVYSLQIQIRHILKGEPVELDVLPYFEVGLVGYLVQRASAVRSYVGPSVEVLR